MKVARHSPRYALLLALLAVGAARAQAPPATLSLQLAEARAAGGGALLYREQHLLRSVGAQPRERLVVYRCPGGAAFARKHVDYAASAQAPAFALEDARSGYAEGMRRNGARTQLYFRARRGTPERTQWLAAAPTVADAGFDEFIRAHWTQLRADQGLPLAFALPSRLRTMQFSVKRVAPVRSAMVHGEIAETFRLRLDGWLGAIAPHIDVAYGTKSRRLLRFDGLSNLRDAQARRQMEVRIDFPAPPRAADEAQWRVAASEALVARCESGQPPDK